MSTFMCIIYACVYVYLFMSLDQYQCVSNSNRSGRSVELCGSCARWARMTAVTLSENQGLYWASRGYFHRGHTGSCWEWTERPTESRVDLDQPQLSLSYFLWCVCTWSHARATVDSSGEDIRHLKSPVGAVRAMARAAAGTEDGLLLQSQLRCFQVQPQTPHIFINHNYFFY